jgi:hypothetical protein
MNERKVVGLVSDLIQDRYDSSSSAGMARRGRSRRRERGNDFERHRI